MLCGIRNFGSSEVTCSLSIVAWGCRDGNLWVALAEGGAVGCYDPDTGDLKRKVSALITVGCGPALVIESVMQGM